MINYTEKGAGLHEALSEAGLSIYELDGVWHSDSDHDAVNAFIASYVPSKSALLADINKKCEDLIQQLGGSYPMSEILSWDKQEAEARSGGGPLTDALAAARGIPAELLREKIIQKADAYAAACGAVIGIRQRLEDEILAGGTNIEWPE